jgi:hypothetical protein
MATGDLRVLSEGSSCRPNEQPVTLNSQNPVAIAVNGNDQTKTASVPDLGTVTLTCNETGEASLSVASSDPFEFRADVTTINGLTQTSLGRGDGLTANSATDPFGKLVAAVLSKEGVGAWKLDVTLRPRQAIGGGTSFHCFAFAAITIAR